MKSTGGTTMSAGSTMQQWSDRSNSAAHRRYPPHLQIPRLQTTTETPRHAILNPETDSAANVATDNEAKQRQLVEAGYKHGEGAPALLALELPHFSCNVLTCAALFYAATFIDRTGAAAYLL
ncbi:hypothetical protein PF001_g32210 [Phytophthora fragariae]|uniref:Uncharacterized protein n=1 Tax=Phytophthora fragariae TaxID=53985 RepID=A0A6A4AVP2_9STRA|nr:hypothetical protein PF001_g32210 [Phytophthora fragariae]